jgi:hypothetical protein
LLGIGEQSRAAGGGDVVGDPGAGKGGNEELRELELEAGDLPSQLDPRRALVPVQEVGEAS